MLFQKQLFLIAVAVPDLDGQHRGEQRGGVDRRLHPGAEIAPTVMHGKDAVRRKQRRGERPQQLRQQYHAHAGDAEGGQA